MQHWTTYFELRHEQRRIDHVLRSALPVVSPRTLGGWQRLRVLLRLACEFICGSSAGGPIRTGTELGSDALQVQNRSRDEPVATTVATGSSRLRF
jgi:hypothetical protein